jgi:hypothetical protein
MAEMSRGQELHKRVCSGHKLSEEERVELESWYSEMDREEAQALRPDLAESPTNEGLRIEIRDRIDDLQAALDKIRDIEEKNALLRRQNEELKRQLVARGILAA